MLVVNTKEQKIAFLEINIMKQKEDNYAFIDSNNLNLAVRELGWKLDFQRFRIYLKENYDAVKSYLFIGYLPKNQNLYRSLQEYGYILIFKPVMRDSDGAPKGNVDAELVLQAMIDYDKYEKAVIVSNDGDFYCLVNYLYKKEKLKEGIKSKLCKMFGSIEESGKRKD